VQTDIFITERGTIQKYKKPNPLIHARYVAAKPQPLKKKTPAGTQQRR